MRYSQLFGKTSKNIPSDADSINAKLLTQAGFISKQLSGIYTYLPLGFRVLTKIQNIIREEITAVGGQEIFMPVLSQLENWQISGRNTLDILFKLKGSGNADLVLNPTHEEVVTPLAKKYTFSYRDLPFALFQIQTKFRNEPRAKSGLLRGREFSMKDLYSFHRDEADLDNYYEQVKKAYFKIYQRLGLGENTILTYASGGSFSQFSHEFQAITPQGEDTIYLCEKCQVAVNKEIIDTQRICPECCNPDLKEIKGIEVGNIFKLKTKFSKAFDFTFVDSDGKKKIVQMGCYGLGPSRTMGAIVENFYDKKGIIWPKSVTPYQVHLIGLDGLGEDLYQKLLSENIDVLFDDRDNVTAGAKFADADLIGIPICLIISKRSQNKGGIEYKLRSKNESQIIDHKSLISRISEFYT